MRARCVAFVALLALTVVPAPVRSARDKDILGEKRLLTPAVVLPAEAVGTASATLNLESFPKELRDLFVGQFEMRLADLKEEKKDRETKAQHDLRVEVIDQVSATLK